MSRLCESENKKYANLHCGFRAKFLRICGDPMITADRGFFQILGPDFRFWFFGSSDRGSQRRAGKLTFSFFMCLCHAVEKMTRTSNALMRDGSVMADSDLVDFLRGSTDSAINFSGSADLHTLFIPLSKLLLKSKKKQKQNRKQNISKTHFKMWHFAC